MADHFITINGQSVQLIPLGYCACGCGGKTKVSPRNVREYGWIKGQPRKYILGHNSKMENHPMWNGGKTITPGGYIQIYKPTHHRANKTGYVFEHILVVEDIFGIPLPDEYIVHHINENRADNSRENLIVCTRYEHSVIHQKKRAKEACGNENWRKCKICKQYDCPINLVIYKSKGKEYGYDVCAHRECYNKHARKYVRKH